MGLWKFVNKPDVDFTDENLNKKGAFQKRPFFIQIPYLFLNKFMQTGFTIMCCNIQNIHSFI